MKPDQREVEREELKRLQSKSEYKRNPRFVPPLKADLVKSKERTKTPSKKEKYNGYGFIISFVLSCDIS